MASHLSTFDAIHYRGVDGIHLEDIRAVNLITGPNGVGKTSLAEALWLFNGRFDGTLLWNPLVQRSQRGVVNAIAHLAGGGVVQLAGTEEGKRHEWKATFESVRAVGGARTATKGSTDTSLEHLPVASPRGRLRTWLDGEEADDERQLVFSANPDGCFVAPVINLPVGRGGAVVRVPRMPGDPDKETIRRFSSLVAAGLKDELRKALGFTMPSLADLEVITDASGEPFILATTSEGDRLPIQAFGAGVVRLLNLLVSFQACRNGLLIIDEFETSLHFRVLPEVWGLLRSMVDRYNVQVFATTQSIECIEAAIDIFSDQPGRLAVHVLSRPDGAVRATAFAGETLQAAREMNFDLR